MPGYDLIMYDEEFQRIKEILSRLRMETNAKVRIMGIGLMNIARNPSVVATRAVRTAGPAAVIVIESASLRS